MTPNEKKENPLFDVLLGEVEQRRSIDHDTEIALLDAQDSPELTREVLDLLDSGRESDAFSLLMDGDY